MVLKYATAVALVLISLVCVLQGQEPTDATIRVTSENVLMDLIVTDLSGRPVTDLQPEDIEVFEDGKRQRLLHFEFQQHAPPTASVEPSHPIAFAAPSKDLYLVVLIDLGTIQEKALGRIRDSLAQLFRSDRTEKLLVLLATFRTGLVIHQEFTDDLDRVQKALDSLNATLDPAATQGTFEQFSKKLDELFFGAGFLDGVSASANYSRSFLSILENQVASLTQSIAAMARFLRPLPGRKHLVLYSTGYPLQPHQIARDLIERRIPGSRTLRGAAREQLNAMLASAKKVEVIPYLQVAAGQANRAQVSIYAVDPRGLMPSSMAGEAHEVIAPTEDYMALRRDAITTAPHEFLNYLASATGGRSLFNQNELDVGIHDLDRDWKAYYLLAYQPATPRKNGKFYSIDVKVQRPDVVTRLRQGYLASDAETESTSDIMTAVKFPDLFRGDPFHIEVAQGPDQLTITTLIPTESLRFHSDGTTHHGSIEIFGFLFDASGKWVGEEIFFSKGQRLNLTTERKRQVLEYANVTLSANCRPPDPGTYTLIVVVRQKIDGSLSTLRQPLTIA